MNKLIKNRKIIKEIKKNIIKIIINKFNHILGKKNIINITYLNLSKNFAFVDIYINFINSQNNQFNINKIKILQKYEFYIRTLLKKNIYIKYIPKIYFKYDEFYTKKKNIFKYLCT